MKFDNFIQQKSKMIFSSTKSIVFLILTYPLIYLLSIFTNQISTAAENIYFSLVIIFASLFILNSNFLKIKLQFIYIFIFLASLFLIGISNFSEIRYTKPIYFILYIMILSMFAFNKNINFLNMQSMQFSNNIFYFTLLVSVILALLNVEYSELGRFYSFLISPTVFCVVLDAMFIIYLFTSKSKKIFLFFIYTVLIYLHILSGTRINLLFLVLIPFLYSFTIYSSKKIKYIVLIFYIVCLNLLYPIYSYYTLESSNNNIFASRYQDNRDASFGLRIVLTYSALEVLSDSSSYQILFGHGMCYTRELIIRIFEDDILLHNDFLRLLIDYGLVFTLMYILLIIKLALKNNISYMLVMLYFLSFYHNMVYSFYLFSLIVMSNYFIILRSGNDFKVFRK